MAVVISIYARAIRENREPTPEEIEQLTAAFSRLDVAAYSKPLFDADGDQKQLRCLIRH